MQKVLIIVGPTAVGKTSLGIKLAKHLKTEVISGDSMQIYREVKIGTAKPTIKEQAEVVHHLVDERSIFEDYSVRNFVEQADEVISNLNKENKLPLVVGGTGFYLNALINDYQMGEEGSYASPVESKWEEFLVKNGEVRLWEELNSVDPVAAQKIPYQNSRRVMRALSVITRTNKKFSEQQTEIKPRYDALIIGLETDRDVLYDRINDRVDQMMDQDLLDEAKFVYDNQAKMFQAIQAIGYKEFFPYFDGEVDLETAIEKLKQASRKYAKRQLTYFKNKLPVKWFDPIKDPDFYTKILNEIGAWMND